MSATRYTDAKVETILSYAAFCAGQEYPKFPLQTFLEVSNVCDLKCAMCTDFSALNPYRFMFLKAHERGFMGTEYKENLEGLLRGTLLVQTSGYGEPTVHPEFREFIDFISNYEVMIEFITNGMHLTRDFCDFLVQRNVYRLLISFSGMTKEEYEGAYIGGKYEQVLSGIENLAAAKKAAGKKYPRIEINSLAFKHHVARFDEFVSMMADLGANSVYLKILQPLSHIPELYEHVSIMRPWVEGKIVERAAAIGHERGVIVSPEQYVEHAAHSQEEYDLRMSKYEAEAKAHPGERGFGENSVQDMRSIVRQPVKDKSPRAPRPVISSRDSVDDAAKALKIGVVPEAGEFFCMEPFKVAYVRKDGAVQACCFGDINTPSMGSVKAEKATDIWHGPGYKAFQDGVIKGEYPTTFCGRCLKDRVGPSDHYGFNVVGTFLEWYSASHSGDVERLVEARGPASFVTIINTRNSQIVDNFRKGGKDCAIEPPAGGLPFEGNFELVENERAIGWAWLPSHPDYQVPITILEGEKVISSGVACRPRSDLVRAGKGDGFHGFNVLLPKRDAGWSKSDLTVVLTDGRRLPSA